jgi:dynein heavy chain, axonemal
MGSIFVEPPQFNLNLSYEDSNAQTPLVFILSPGVDPLIHLYKLANEKAVSGNKLKTISLGQGQGPIATQMIEESMKIGAWVVLQNCHLAQSFLGELEKICADILNDKESIKPDFRLWLTSYPTPLFPVTILQNSIKMTNEPPTGLKSNLMRSYLSDPIADMNFFEDSKNEFTWKKLLFGLCFFHAVVQERRKFGPLGWNIPYEFNESDLRISMRQLKLFLSTYKEPPLIALNYLTAECNYGGRVTDAQDRRLISTLLKVYYNQEMLANNEYKFSSLNEYHAPRELSYDGCVEYIRQLPLITSPEVFGLNKNANITKDNQETQQLFDGILLTLPRKNNDGKNKTQDIIEELANDILKKLPDNFNLEEVQAKYPVLYEESMNVVLVQELIRFNGLINVIRNSILDLKKAISGILIMSKTLEDVFDSLLVNKIPSSWASKSYPSLKPLGSYISDLCARLTFLQEWIENGSPVVYWLSGFYFTQSFLTGIMQNYARKHRIPIDVLVFEFEFCDKCDLVEKPDRGAYVKGLFMEGARWCSTKMLLQDSLSKVLFDQLPIIWIKPNERVKVIETLHYECPVYKTSARRGTLSTTGHSTNYVLNIKIPSDRSQSYWINRGVAALCQLDD